jgi:hypothetical protein
MKKLVDRKGRGRKVVSAKLSAKNKFVATKNSSTENSPKKLVNRKVSERKSRQRKTLHGKFYFLLSGRPREIICRQ